MAEPIEMSFGLVTWWAQGTMYSMGVQIHRRGRDNFCGLSGPALAIFAAAFTTKGIIQSPIMSCNRRDHSVCQASTNNILKISGHGWCDLSSNYFDHLLWYVIARQAVTDGFHFSDDILRSLHSFPLELVSRLRQRTSPCSNELELSADIGQHNADASVDELLPNSSLCDRPCDTADYVTCTHDEPMEGCIETAITASHTESVDMADGNTVLSLLFVLNFLLNICL